MMAFFYDKNPRILRHRYKVDLNLQNSGFFDAFDVEDAFKT